jgi:outer membrane protein OmpA-like peptidoglycan-associated protein
MMMVFAAALPQALNAEKFEFKHRLGDKFRILSKTEEQVLKDGALIQSASILNRMASEVTRVENGRAVLNAVFNVAEEAQSGDKSARFSWGEEYSSVFSRDRLGKITIDKKYFMPSARDLPLFPDRDIAVGESWISQGDEVLDLRRTFEINEPYSIAFRANNTYLGEREWKNKRYKAISISYNLLKNNVGFENSPRTYLSTPKNAAVPERERAAIKRITGTSKQILYWDEALGQIAAAEDQFELNFELGSGEKWTFRGKTVSEIIEAERLDREEAVREIEKAIASLAIKDVSVKAVDEGIAISLDNIQFAPDSAELLPSEYEKLNKIAAILKKFSARDILVGGHTAQAGSSESARVKLSEERAGAVAGYLIKEKVRAPERLIIRGFGSSRPAASNSTEEGRQKNRRVEITILEN